MSATLLRYNNSRNVFCFPTLNQSFKGGSFHISNTEDYTTFNMSETNNFVLCRFGGGCWLPYLARNIHPEVSGSLFPFKFISHDRVLDRQFFMLQVDLTLDSKFTAYEANWSLGQEGGGQKRSLEHEEPVSACPWREACGHKSSLFLPCTSRLAINMTQNSGLGLDNADASFLFRSPTEWLQSFYFS